MVNFNATQVGLERTAAFYCDLPLGIDERQLAGNNQGALEKIVYMIASGTGKIRGAKAGGIQTVHQWRTVALATGEEPLSTETTQTGVSTRVLEMLSPVVGMNEHFAALIADDLDFLKLGKILEFIERHGQFRGHPHTSICANAALMACRSLAAFASSVCSILASKADILLKSSCHAE